MKNHVLMVLSNPVPGREAEYNDWYDNVHLGEVLALPGFVAAQRFARAGEPVAGELEHRYLAIYEIEGDDPKPALEALRKGARSMNMSDALEAGRAVAAAFTPRGERVTG